MSAECGSNPERGCPAIEEIKGDNHVMRERITALSKGIEGLEAGERKHMEYTSNHVLNFTQELAKLKVDVTKELGDMKSSLATVEKSIAVSVSTLETSLTKSINLVILGMLGTVIVTVFTAIFQHLTGK